MKEEIPGEAPQHAHRPPGADGFGVVGANGQRHAGKAVRYGGGGRHQHQQGRNHHDEALNDVCVDRSDDAAGDAVEHQDRERYGHAGFQAQPADRSIGDDVLQDGGHGQNLGPQVAHHTQQDGEGGQQAGEPAVVAGGHHVRQRHRLFQLGQQADALPQQVEGDAGAHGGADHHPQGAHSHVVDQTRTAHEAEPAHDAGKDGETGDDDPQVPAGHEEVRAGSGPPKGPQTHRDADSHVDHYREQDGDAPVRVHQSFSSGDSGPVWGLLPVDPASISSRKRRLSSLRNTQSSNLRL